MSFNRLNLVAFTFALTAAVSAGAADFTLTSVPDAQSGNDFDLKSDCGGKPYLDFMKGKLHPRMIALAQHPSRHSNEDALRAGEGVAVQLDEHNYNFHVNFPNNAQGGRSYGWTSGKVGDWSDKMYLDNLAGVVADASDEELNGFYQTVIQMLGQCNAGGLSGLGGDAQRVATNFLAIYSAEEYRALVGTPNWDDALLQVTMVGAFHGGQKTLTKFYLGEFKADSFKQAPGVYRGSVAGTPKKASMNDYWQFSANETSKRSGINLTRKDFELMGKAITKYESTVAKSRSLKAIQAVVGNDPNVIKAVTQYFVKGSADASKTAALSKAVADFLVEVRGNAEKITTWEAKGER